MKENNLEGKFVSIDIVRLVVKLTKGYRVFDMCPELCSDRPSHNRTSGAKGYFIRLQDMLAGNLKMTPDEDTETPNKSLVTHGRIKQYLAASRFPLLRHEARIALSIDRGI